MGGRQLHFSDMYRCLSGGRQGRCHASSADTVTVPIHAVASGTARKETNPSPICMMVVMHAQVPQKRSLARLWSARVNAPTLLSWVAPESNTDDLPAHTHDDRIKSVVWACGLALT